MRVLISGVLLLSITMTCSVAQEVISEKDMHYYIGIAPKDKLQRARADLQRTINNAVDTFKYREIKSDEKVKPSSIRTFSAADPNPQGRLGHTIITTMVKDDENCLVQYVGPFGPNSTEAFIDAAKYLTTRNCKKTLVALKSPGGKGEDGMKVGVIIRYLQWDTLALARKTNRGGCASACSFAYLGGVNRYKPLPDDVASGGGVIMVHQGKDPTGACITDPLYHSNIKAFAYFMNMAPSVSYGLMAKALSKDCQGVNPVLESDGISNGVYNQTYTTAIQEQFGLSELKVNPESGSE